METYLAICFKVLIYIIVMCGFVLVPLVSAIALTFILSGVIFIGSLVYKFAISKIVTLPRFEQFTSNLFNFRTEFWVIFLVMSIFALPLGYKAGSEIVKDAQSKERKIVYEPVKIERYFLRAYRPPKHFYVSIEHTSSGQVYEDLYVSKHCNLISNEALGKEYNINIQNWYYEDAPLNRYVKFNNLYQVFCE